MAETIKDYFKVDKMQTLEDENERTEYTLAAEDVSTGDIIIKKEIIKPGRKKNSVRYLALLFSQGDFFFTNENKTSRTALTGVSQLDTFFNGVKKYEKIFIKAESLPVVYKESYWFENLKSALINPELKLLLRHRIITVPDYLEARNYYVINANDKSQRSRKRFVDFLCENAKLIDDFFDIHEKITGLPRKVLISDFYGEPGLKLHSHYSYPHYRGKPITHTTIESFVILANIYGEEVAKDMYKEWVSDKEIGQLSNPEALIYLHMATPSDFPYEVEKPDGITINQYGMHSILMKGIEPKIRFEPEKFKAYLLTEPKRCGLEEDMFSFIELWADAIGYQTLMEKDPINKYPDNIITTRYLYCSEYQKRKKEITEQKWLDLMALMQRYKTSYKTSSGDVWRLLPVMNIEQMCEHSTEFHLNFNFDIKRATVDSVHCLFCKVGSSNERYHVELFAKTKDGDDVEITDIKSANESLFPAQTFSILAKLCEENHIGIHSSIERLF